MSKTTRRNFLKSTVTATAAAIAFPTIIPQRAFGANERIQMGLIGSGGRGCWLAQHFSNLEEATVTAVCDVDTRRRGKGVELINNIHENKECKSYSDFRELLQNRELDAVIVATPDHWHSLVGIAAAKAGKHIYCEKPLCNSIGESKALRDAVVASGVKLQTGSHERSRDQARYCVELIRNGYIGNLREMQINLPTTEGHHQQIRKRRGSVPAELAVPKGLDWNFWWATHRGFPTMRAWTPLDGALTSASAAVKCPTAAPM